MEKKELRLQKEQKLVKLKKQKRKTPTKGGTTGEDTVSESGVWFLPSSLVY